MTGKDNRLGYEMPYLPESSCSSDINLSSPRTPVSFFMYQCSAEGQRVFILESSSSYAMLIGS